MLDNAEYKKIILISFHSECLASKMKGIVPSVSYDSVLDKLVVETGGETLEAIKCG